MYSKAYGIIQTFAPLHVGAAAGEESGNLNLIFRDQFTQTGVIPGSSIRGRMRSEMRRQKNEDEANKWYGKEAEAGKPDSTTESLVKFEYASIAWLPVFCPGQPIVWVTSPRLLKRYQRIASKNSGSPLKNLSVPAPYTASQTLKALDIEGQQKLFFNFGFLTIEKNANLLPWFPLREELPAVVVGDDEIAMIHDMALYRQSRVALEKDEKKAKKGAFFNTEALPEDTILAFPIALKDEKTGEKWQPFNGSDCADIYLGGLESIGFGHCEMTLFI
ncbi:MAG: type III-B CRISPR module RAMP protein Cmr4 [Scytonematopsis contorta HA4267-MV1]|jgi:CRISPR-associated protein Cmr4|nr:type III-B CRISPR module RAMP protein Cmr4 [Scytonematopsis contorta HA4267-MV1]